MNQKELLFGSGQDEIYQLGTALNDMRQRLIDNIVAQNKADEALRESEEKFRVVFEQAPDSVVLIDTETGKIIEFNDRAHEILGYTREEFANLLISDIDIHESPEDVKMHIEKITRDGFEIFETKHRTKDGRLLNVCATVRALSMRGHSFLASIWTDITQRKKVEAQKANLEARLQQAQKMEAIGTLAGGIAHDFNNILAVILGYADMAKDDAPPDTKFARDLEKVLEAGNRAKDLIKQILAFSRQTEVQRIPIQIQSLIKEALKMLRSSIPTTIEIHDDIDSRCGAVLSDPTQVHQILMNLCTNASYAMEKTGGILKIGLKSVCIDKGGHRQVPLNMEFGEYVELIVSDTGSGIASDVIDKIFDPYFTTKEPGKGTGMGLAIVHGIVADYGGTITVESELDKGTIFHVFFPLIDQEELPLVKEIDKIPRGQERILFIDDEELLAEMGQDMLERLGYHVTVRRSSLDALAIFQNAPNEFDIVITDQTMPDMTGSDLARRMMQIRPDVPIILCTGYSNLIDENSAKALGIKEFALKPLTKGVIAKLIRKVLNGK